MKKFVFTLAVILSILSIILAFSPIITSPIRSLSWMTILIVAIPGILSIIATITAIKFRPIGAIMFIILTFVFGYFIYSQLLSKEYLSITILFLLAGNLFLMSASKNTLKNQNLHQMV